METNGRNYSDKYGARYQRMLRKDPEQSQKARIRDSINHLGRVIANDPQRVEEIFEAILHRAAKGAGRQAPGRPTNCDE